MSIVTEAHLVALVIIIKLMLSMNVIPCYTALHPDLTRTHIAPVLGQQPRPDLGLGEHLCGCSLGVVEGREVWSLQQHALLAGSVGAKVGAQDTQVGHQLACRGIHSTLEGGGGRWLVERGREGVEHHS